MILTIQCKVVLGGVQLGDSIAVNGVSLVLPPSTMQLLCCDGISGGLLPQVCLTVTSFTKTQFTAGLSPETIRRTNLGDLKAGNMVGNTSGPHFGNDLRATPGELNRGYVCVPPR